MTKQILLFCLLSVSLVSCGQKSVIKNAVPAQSTADAYGDGVHTIFPLIMPLSDEVIESFDSPLSKIGFVAGGFAKLFMNIGAGMGMGKLQLTMIQPVPEIPRDYFHETKIKRIFFYIEPVKGSRTRNWFERTLWGRENVNFKFIDKIAVKLSSHHVENNASWTPIVETKSIGKREFTPLQRLFENKEQLYPTVKDIEAARELILLKYDGKHSELYTKNDENGSTYIMKTEEPAKSRRFLMDHPKLKGYFRRIHILNKSLLVELEKDPVIEEGFKVILSENATDLEALGVSFIDMCTKQTCLDLSVPDLNLIPILVKDNAIKLDAYINAQNVPDSFQLKGFVEFEIKLKLTF
jgi:hypothetical protein